MAYDPSKIQPASAPQGDRPRVNNPLDPLTRNNKYPEPLRPAPTEYTSPPKYPGYGSPPPQVPDQSGSQPANPPNWERQKK